MAQSFQTLSPQDQVKFRNMSSSELERYMYITDHPMYNMVWNRREPFPERSVADPIGKNTQQVLNTEFLETKRMLDLLASYVAKGITDRIRLIQEIQKLSEIQGLGVLPKEEVEKIFNATEQKPFNFETGK